MLQNLKNKIKGKKYIYTFLLTLLYPYRKYLDSRQRKIYETWNRKNEVIIARRQVTIEESDSVIVYINDKKSVSEIEKLFQPSAFFI